MKKRRKLQKLCVAKTKKQVIVDLISFSDPNQVDIWSNIHYHKTCLKEAEVRISKNVHKQRNMESNGTQTKSDLGGDAFTRIRQQFVSVIVEQKCVMALTDVHRQYEATIQEAAIEQKVPIPPSMNSRILKERLLSAYPDVTTKTIRNKVFFHHKNIQDDVVVMKCCELDTLEDKIKHVAIEIRKIVLNCRKYNLPKKNISAADINRGECEIPPSLHLLVQYMVAGPCGTNSERKNVRIASICNNLIFAISNGKIMPADIIRLGLVCRSISGRRRLPEILNRLGHSISYSTIEEIESELAYGCEEMDLALPSSLVPNSPHLHTHLGFDNYDRYVETKNGKNTLHDTVGIVIQNVGCESSNVRFQVDSNSQDSTQQKRRRRFICNPDKTNVEPYVQRTGKWPKFTELRAIRAPDNLQTVQNFDRAWMMMHAFDVDNTPRWVKWNADRISDENPIQKIGYLPQINMSPTNDAAVQKTMQIALEIARNCNQKHIIVSYDLAIAKKALKIQKEMSPAYDEIFINLGAFHLEMSFFKAVGKYIDSSGIPEVLINCDLLAQGSLVGFLTGTNFNRCKNLHMIATTSFKKLHFAAFMKGTFPDDLDRELRTHEIHEMLAQSGKSLEGLRTKELEQLLTKYDQFCSDTMQGIHGATARYIMGYIRLIDQYLLLERSTRTCDIDLYMYTIYEMCSIFFIFNHHNYAKYTCMYLNNLLEADEGVINELVSGALSTRRSVRNFARVPNDLVLEQTQNADASNKLTGIVSMHNSVDTRRKWAVTHSELTYITSNFLEAIGMVKMDDVSETEYQSNVFKKQVNAAFDEIGNNIDPFSSDIRKDRLFNISTGKAAENETSTFLLGVFDAGKKQMEEFWSACANNGDFFDNPLRKNKLQSFATENSKSRAKRPSKICETRHERDMMSHILCLAIEKGMEIRRILEYPLASAPPSLAHCDGTGIFNDNRDELASILSSSTNSEPGIHDHAIEFIDGFYFLGLHQNAPMKFGAYAVYILRQLCSSAAAERYLIFDNSDSPIHDIGASKKKDLYDDGTAFVIRGPQQSRPENLRNYLYKNSFKNALVEFLLDAWAKNENSTNDILGEKRLFVTFGPNCYIFAAEHPKKKVISRFRNNHVDIESQIIMHIYKASQQHDILIKMRNIDSIIVNILYHMQFWGDSNDIIVESGDETKKIRINVSHIRPTLTSNIIQALPAWYVFCGSKYEPAFFGKRAKTHWKVLKRNESFQNAFANIGLGGSIDETDMKLIERYTCQLYMPGMQTLDDVNHARLLLFEKYNGAKYTGKRGMDRSN